MPDLGLGFVKINLTPMVTLNWSIYLDSEKQYFSLKHYETSMEFSHFHVNYALKRQHEYQETLLLPFTFLLALLRVSLLITSAGT